MNIEHAIEQIDGMIESLQSKRTLLETAQKMIGALEPLNAGKPASQQAGKPAKKAAPKKPAPKKGQITPAGRKRIVEAQRKRWAKARKAATSHQPSAVSQKNPARPAAKKAPVKKSGPAELKDFHATESAAPDDYLESEGNRNDLDSVAAERVKKILEKPAAVEVEVASIERVDEEYVGG